MGEKQNRNMREIYVEIEGNKYRIGEISEITDLKVDFEKPPLGLIPKRFHDKLRIAEIEGAIMRYIESERPIPTEWLEEFLVETRRGSEREFAIRDLTKKTADTQR